MIVRRRYQQHPDRYEYLPTGKGREFVPILLAMVAWGDRWAATTVRRCCSRTDLRRTT